MLVITMVVMLVLAIVIVFHHSVGAKDHLSPPPHSTTVHQPSKRGARKGLDPPD